MNLFAFDSGFIGKVDGNGDESAGTDESDGIVGSDGKDGNSGTFGGCHC